MSHQLPRRAVLAVGACLALAIAAPAVQAQVSANTWVISSGFIGIAISLM